MKLLYMMGCDWERNAKYCFRRRAILEVDLIFGVTFDEMV